LKLINKKVRIYDNAYEVKDQYYDLDNEEEVLILKRKVDIKQKIKEPNKSFPDTIFDLGYSSISEIDYPEDLMRNTWYEDIIPKIKNGRYVTIAFINTNGQIVPEKIFIQSLDILDPNVINVVTDKKRSFKMSKDDLIKGYLIINKDIANWNEQETPSKKIEDIMEEVFREITRSTSSEETFDNRKGRPLREEDLDEISIIFNEFFNRRFHG